MLAWVKFLPLLLVAAGTVYAGSHAPEFLDRTVDKVKVLLTGMEVERICQTIQVEAFTSGMHMEGAEEFGEFLRNYYTTPFGSRDPAMDLWDAPYLLERGEDAVYLVASSGPNRGRDACRTLDGESPGQTLDASDGRSDTGDSGAEEEGDPAGEDDICASVEIPRSESPFQQLEE